MPNKRRFPLAGSSSLPHAKRARPSYTEDDLDDDESHNSVTPYERPRQHPVFGQKSAFPGLDAAGADELFYGPAEDGLEYLRMVRSEANSLPTLFTAPTAPEPPTESTKVTADFENAQVRKDAEEETKDLQGEAEPPTHILQGIYSDGVYISLTTTKPTAADEPISDAQESYYNLLHHRFLLIRSILKCTPPSEAIAALDTSHPISLPRKSKAARKEWRRLLLDVDPQTVQLACMDMESVLGVLGIMARLMSENVRSGNAVLVRRIGAWAWGLLGKCRDVGELGAEEVGEIREVGKRAARVLRKMREEDKGVHGKRGEAEEEDGYESDVEMGYEWTEEKVNEPTAPAVSDDSRDAEKGDDDAEELERAKARLEAQVQEAAAAELSPETKEKEEGSEIDSEGGIDVGTQARAMLDMIITVVGEHYGQRDLLEARERWTEGSKGFSAVF